MSNPTVIVTGASRGLGAAIARQAARLGANVVLNARSGDDLAEVQTRISKLGGTAAIVAGDIGSPEVCRDLAAAAANQFGGIDAVVNNAGILGPIASLADLDPLEWQRNWRINVLGPAMLVHYALPSLRERGGRVINVSSGAAERAVHSWGAYCAAKGALNQLNRQIAEEEPAITALAVAPGVVDTAMQRQIREQGADAMPDEDYARFVDYYEQDELLPPDEPGRALAVLALHTPAAWSGEALRWNDEKITDLVEAVG